jgi:hypothetical protein
MEEDQADESERRRAVKASLLGAALGLVLAVLARRRRS